MDSGNNQNVESCKFRPVQRRHKRTRTRLYETLFNDIYKKLCKIIFQIDLLKENVLITKGAYLRKLY